MCHSRSRYGRAGARQRRVGPCQCPTPEPGPGDLSARVHGPLGTTRTVRHEQGELPRHCWAVGAIWPVRDALEARVFSVNQTAQHSGVRIPHPPQARTSPEVRACCMPAATGRSDGNRRCVANLWRKSPCGALRHPDARDQAVTGGLGPSACYSSRRTDRLRFVS